MYTHDFSSGSMELRTEPIADRDISYELDVRDTGPASKINRSVTTLTVLPDTKISIVAEAERRSAVLRVGGIKNENIVDEFAPKPL